MKDILPIILFVLLSANLTAQPFTDIDKDNDGLIEVSDIETLNAMRYRLDGSGLQLSTATAVVTTGCAVGGCKGYELTRDLDFNDVASYQNLANMKLWTTDAGWQPIGTAEQPFTAIFKTNNSSIPNTIFNLKISRADESNVGLFGHIGSTAEISGIGLLDATVEGNHQVGSLVGKNAGGQISNSYANGHVVGKGGAIGLLVGHSSGSITNSYANGEVSGEANGIGGLVGANHGEIANSYAMGSVVGSANNVGGLVGDNLQGTISNCYTTGSVSGSEDIGGLAGISNLGTLISNYVSGKASGKRYIGGLVGSNIGGTITRSYWDKTASNLEGNTGGVGLLAGELQSANAQDEDLKKPYYKWSTAHWDFGTAEQYPILKYATGSDLNNPVCGPEQTLPNCGALLLGQHASLKHILFLSDVNLSPNFKPTELNYQLGITTSTKTLQLIPIASNPDSSINISRNGIVIDSDLANGTTSSVITLGENTEIVIEVSAANQRPAQYSLTTHYLQEITILGIPDKAIDEGESIILDASQNLATADTLLSYRWTQSRGKTLFPPLDSEGAILWLHIPEDYVPATAEHANLGLTLEINNGKTTLTKNITLTIAKVDNGNIPVAPPTLTILEGTAPEIDLGKDPDGSGKDFSYQWQSRAPGQDTKWIDINEATEKTYIISFLTESYTEYRVLINYTDGQGYKTIAASKAARYVPEIMILDSIKGLASEETIPADAKPQRTSNYDCSNEDIDDDDDGLIEICDLEALNAMRHVMDGSSYKASASATTSTRGCPVGGCNGYELIKDLDFNDDASYSSIANKVIWTEGDGWDPIGYYHSSTNNKVFTAIFEGNDHTISNLMIDRPNTNYVGLFGYIERGTINKVSLLDVDIQGASVVGGLVGYSYGGTITNSYATGAVTGTGGYVGGLVGSSYGTIRNSYATGAVKGAWDVGGLVGYADDGTITNSYATGAVEGNWDVGGLVGYADDGTITNSYATGAVEGVRVGGLVGWNHGTIRNSYATGAVEGNWDVGGLVGRNYGTIRNSYATGAVTGTGSDIGGLVGDNQRGTITNSYWNTQTSGIASSTYLAVAGIGKTTAELQDPTSAIGIYAQWSTANWDFGTDEQYPILKYAKGPDENNPACREQGDTTKDLPVCDSLLPLVLRGLSELRLVQGNLSPSFIVARQNYRGTAVNTTNTIRFKPIAMNPAATISISVDGVTVGEDRPSGTTSSKIMLKQNGKTKIIISVKNGGIISPIEYTLHLDYYDSKGDIDMDGNGLIDIDTLEKLNAMRYQLDGTGYRDSEDTPKITIGCPDNKCKGYELKKDLDFNDDASYSSIANKVIWTRDEGWHPIGYYESRNNANNRPFTAIFEGNDHTISNLMINISSATSVGLFGYAAGVTINKVGLLDVDIQGVSRLGGLVGLNSSGGTITNSYATGSVTGTRNYVGGLVGLSRGTITNSYATSAVKGDDFVGGLVGENYGTITNSYATGAVTGTRYYVGGLVGYAGYGTITNSYATGAVTGTGGYVGGLVGLNWNGPITNSYATGAVTSTEGSVGGLVGSTTSYGPITNSYATGAVTSTEGSVGGLVGLSFRGIITNSYATGAVTGTTSRWSSVGGLVGYNSGTITNSSSKTTTELQEPTSAIGIYAQWSTVHWDFGTSRQYPVLKYAVGPDIDNPACDGLVGQPACDALLPGQQSDLEQLTVSLGTLSPSPFDPQTYNYVVMVEYNVDSITLNTTATGATIHITSNTSDLEVNTTNTSSITIPLTITTDTIITITVTNDGQKPTPYTITVSYNVPGNLVSPNITGVTDDEDDSLLKVDEKVQAKEGQQIKLHSDDCTVDVECRLGFPDYPSLSLARNTLEFTVPVDFVEANRSTQDFVVVFAIGKNRDIASKETTLVVEKENNGSISNIGQPTLAGSQLIAPEIDLLGDPDKGVQKSSLKYQWQRKTGVWGDIGGATASTYTPGDMTEGEEYLVQISYTDGQGYELTLDSKAIRDIDVDDDGLIEIRSIDDLDAIRYQLDGTGYTTSTSADKITTGCPTDGCKGYELTKDLDFNDNDSYSSISNKVIWTTGEGWQPIGNNLNSFSGIFNGNNYTISNLMIKRPGSAYIGLFAMINNSARIESVNLNKVDIVGRKLVGALVGKNIGGTIRNIQLDGNSSTTSIVVGMESQVGGLVGMNAEGSVIDNVDLDRVSIKGGNQVGGLVGMSKKSTIRNINVRGDSSTTSTIVGTEDEVGGLVGMNAGGSEIDNVDLYKVSIKGRNQVGGLAGKNQGIIINSRVSGDSDAITNRVKGEGDIIGGLVGVNQKGRIINSHAVANVQGKKIIGVTIGYYVGGLVGRNTGQIINSYADGSVVANENVGGLIGSHLIGNRATGKVINSYATSSVSGTRFVGGLVGHGNGTITNSYWNKTTSGIGTSAGGIGKTTEDLQLPMTPGSASTEIYYGWREEIWDFGSDEQYPALKYANAQCMRTDRTDETDYCKGLSEDQQNFVKSLCMQGNTPARCNELFAGQRLGLKSIDLSGNAVLLEAFENTKYNYTMLVLNGEETIQIIPTAAHDEAEFTLSPSDNSNEITLENGQSTPTITIEVKTNNRKVTYTFEVVRVGARITKTDGRMTITENTFDEGALVFLNASVMKSTDVPFQVKWEWMQMGGERFLETTNTSVTQLTIPTAYIDSNALSVMVTFEVTGTFTIGGKTLESSAEVELTINKDNNGSLKTDDIGELTLNDAKITAPDISEMNEEGKSLLDEDRDGVNENPDIRYHWQKKLSNNVWENVSTTTINIYEVGEDIPDNTEYRVLIRYTDGQGYRKPVASESISYVDIDRDNDGLIEIETREELDAIRHQLDGNGYKANASAAIIIEGCPIIIVNNEEQRQCKGYELKAHIDLSGGGNWEPIDNANDPFNAIFEGNHYTISNLTIDSPDSDNVGFFGTTTRTAEIRNVGLLSVTKIAGRNNVGGLIGSNQGKVIGSYVIVAKREGRNIYGGNNVGGLIGHNEGKVVGSYVIAVKGDGTNIYGTDNVGGLVGLNSNTTITESYAIVKKIDGDTDRTGGLVGKTSGGEISNSYAKVDNMKVQGSSFVCPRWKLDWQVSRQR